jgi:nucleoside-diphosphate-sugar epimerase
MRILVTGSSGFVGHAACIGLLGRGYNVCAFSRSELMWPRGIEAVTAPAMSWLNVGSRSFESTDCILHLAGRAHVLRERLPDPLYKFRRVNVYETLELAKSAALAGVRRFVFVSSVKVNGESTSPGIPFTEADIPKPLDPYGISKYEAEIGLIHLGAETGMEIVIVRPPLIYGPRVKGNFRVMMKLLSLRVPLPFGAIRNNRRSLVALDNLIDFLVLCVSHPEAAGRVFLVSDRADVSTAELLERLGAAMNLPVNLFSVPPFVLKQASRIGSNLSLYRRLCDSLVVDSSAAFRFLGWEPPLDFDEGLRRAAIGFTDWMC